MSPEKILRAGLWCAALFNVLGALLFAFPGSSAGQVLGLPTEVPMIYRTFTGLFVLLFAGAYAWLAANRPVVKPFVVFAALGKAAAFVMIVALWAFGYVSGLVVFIGSGDAVLAAIFVWCLWGMRSPNGPGEL